MKPIPDLTGKVFGKLTALERFVVGDKKKASKWRCICSCGAIREVYATHLIRGNSKSCSTCLGAPVKTMPAHMSWKSMVLRCTNKNHMAYHRYGGRGIKICERWTVFANFLADMGPRPKGRSLDRINTDGDYEPSNCRWATNSEQSNNRANNRKALHDGKLLTIAQIATATGEPYKTVYARLVRNKARRERRHAGKIN